MDRSIKQIIPADGWSAVYAFDGKPVACPLACWALVSEGRNGDESVEGMEGGDSVEFSSDAGNFLGYLPPGGDINVWSGAASGYAHRTRKAEDYRRAADAIPSPEQ